jgi:predicted acyltransferase (DUF342 family)
VRTNAKIRGTTGQRGSVLVMAMIMVVGLGAISLALLGTTSAVHHENGQVVDEMSAFYVAEGALAEAWAVLTVQGRDEFELLEYPLTMQGASYSVEATFGEDDPSLAKDLVRMVATAEDGLAGAGMELIATYDDGWPDTYGVLAGTHLEISSNSYVDSYCSSEGTWQSQASSNENGSDYAGDETLVGSNGDINIDSNSSVFGDATCAASSITTINSNSQVTGSTAPAEELFVLPTVEWPGDNHASLVVVGQTDIVIGPGTFVYDRLIVKSGAKLTFRGPVELYVKNEFVIESNSSVETLSGLPADLNVYIKDGANKVIMNSNTTFTGSLIAPGCDVTLKSNSQLFGALVGDTLHMDSYSSVHTDKCMATGDGAGEETYEIITWQPTAFTGL